MSLFSKFTSLFHKISTNTLTDKWQCVKCKNTKVQVVNEITLDNEKITIDPLDIPKVMCHDHMMRNLSEENYTKENQINDSGARDENGYRNG